MKKRVYLFVAIAIIFLLVIATPILAAVANPNSITAWQPKVFENIWEDGDMLFVLEYDVDYTSEPDEDASVTYVTQLVDTNGVTLLLSRQLVYYQHNVISIYADADFVSSANLTWGSAYKIVLTGNPAIFDTITEGTNKVTKTLSASDYNADGAITSLNLLRSHCINVAEALESDWAVTLISVTTDGTQVLNSTGSVVFLDAIPGLHSAISSLFILSSSIPAVDTQIATANYSISSRIDTRLGTSLSNAFSGIGDFLGIGDNSAAGFWALITTLTIASIIFLNTGNSTAALILAVPVIVMMTYLGAIPEALTYVLAIFVVIYSMYFFWLRGT